VVTHGYSKDHRGDLKQLMYGMLVSADGGVPVFGQVLDGNASDNDATAAFFARVRQLVKDPREVTLVADSKGWCAQVVSLINQQGLRLLSRLPRTTGLHAEIMAKDWAPAGVVEIPAKRRRRDPPDRYEYQGFDAEQTFVLKHPAVDNQPARSERFTIPVRVVRVFSPSLLRRKQGTLERITKREQTAIKRLIRERQHRAYACEEDAKRAAQRDQEQHLYITQRLIATPVPHPAGYRPGRGRPRRVSEPTIDGPHWRITYRSEPATAADIQNHLGEESHFILIRTVPTGWTIADADIILSYSSGPAGFPPRVAAPCSGAGRHPCRHSSRSRSSRHVGVDVLVIVVGPRSGCAVGSAFALPMRCLAAWSSRWCVPWCRRRGRHAEFQRDPADLSGSFGDGYAPGNRFAVGAGGVAAGR
jgi:hypothetical protein